MNRTRPAQGHLLPALRCFNVAAICALAVWHGYAFYLHQAISHESVSPAHELQFLPELPEQASPSDLRKTV